MAKYFLKLDQFEGPLDLLLHLVRANEMDILRIDLLALTTQYLDYLREARFDDLSDASGFIHMAATLIRTKIRQLLPVLCDDPPGGDSDDDPGLREQDLTERLLLFETFRAAGDYFRERLQPSQHLQLGSGNWKAQDEVYRDHSLPLRGQPVVLTILYEQLMTRLAERKPVRVQATTESLTVDHVMARLRETLEQAKVLLMQSLYPNLTSRYELVAHILACLQLVRDRHAKLHQEVLFGPTWLLNPEATAPEAQSMPLPLGERPHA